MPFHFLDDYYSSAEHRNPRVLELCGAVERERPYTSARDPALTAIINGYARPEFLPLIWESLQYQTRRPFETWIIQNDPNGRAAVPRALFDELRREPGTVVVDSGLNHGCWFRFLLAALHCRTRYVAIFDDDTLPGRLALEAALDDLARRPGIYGGRGITFQREPDGPRFWRHDVSGWPVGTESALEVDFVGHLWVMETDWLRELFKHLPERLFAAREPGRECGEDMYLSFVAQRLGLRTFVYGHGNGCNARWSSIQAYEMGFHPNAMNSSGGLRHGDDYLADLVRAGWKLLRY